MAVLEAVEDPEASRMSKRLGDRGEVLVVERAGIGELGFGARRRLGGSHAVSSADLVKCFTSLAHIVDRR
jgi:hypothetical protein